jgi:hypothetical protein
MINSLIECIHEVNITSSPSSPSYTPSFTGQTRGSVLTSPGTSVLPSQYAQNNPSLDVNPSKNWFKNILNITMNILYDPVINNLIRSGYPAICMRIFELWISVADTSRVEGNAYIHICLHKCIYIHTYIYTSVYMSMCICIYKQICVYVFIYINVCIFIIGQDDKNLILAVLQFTCSVIEHPYPTSHGYPAPQVI